MKDREYVPFERLNQMQRYLGEEMVENYRDGFISRRQMLKRVILICGSSAGAAALLNACGEQTLTASGYIAAQGTSGSVSVNQTNSTGRNSSVLSSGSKSPLSVPAGDPAIKAKDVSIQSDIPITGYLVCPSVPGTYPGVIVIHENKGLVEHIRDVTRRIAKAGFVGLAPDLASRGGGTVSMQQDQVIAFLAQAKPEDLVNDLNASVDFLEKQPGVKPGKIGVVGFCFGGGYTLRLAGTNQKIAAAVPYYGPTPQPVTLVTSTNAAILAHYGGTDSRVNAGIPELEKAMQASGKIYQKKVWEGATHAFNNDTGPNYNETAALEAWKETLEWLKKYLN